MTSTSYLAIKVLLLTLGGIFGLLAAVFTLAELWQNDKHDSTRAWFGGKWVRIVESPCMHIPEDVISWMLSAPGVVRTLPRSVIGVIGKEWAVRVVTLTQVGSLFIAFQLSCRLAWYVTGAAFLIAIVLAGSPVGGRVPDETLGKATVGWFLACAHAVAVLAWISLFSRLNTWYAVVVAVFTTPFACVMIAACYREFLNLLGKRDAPAMPAVDYSLVLSISLSITLLAMLVGHLADLRAWVPQTFQMLVSNVIFDSLTIWVTVFALHKALKRRRFRSIPGAILLIIAVGAVFAFCSLGLGLAFTPRALSFRELCYVFIARSPDGGRWEIGPYFWTMHTTFLPVLVYMFVVCVCWVGKAIALIAGNLLGKGYEHKNPLKLTAALFAVLAAFFALTAAPFEFAQRTTERHEQMILQQSQRIPRGLSPQRCSAGKQSVPRNE